MFSRQGTFRVWASSIASRRRGEHRLQPRSSFYGGGLLLLRRMSVWGFLLVVGVVVAAAKPPLLLGVLKSCTPLQNSSERRRPAPRRYATHGEQTPNTRVFLRSLLTSFLSNKPTGTRVWLVECGRAYIYTTIALAESFLYQ